MMSFTSAVDGHLLLRIRMEYLEMPGLQLTMAQMRRLWGLEKEACRRILEELTATHFLRRTERDQYVLDAPSR